MNRHNIYYPPRLFPMNEKRRFFREIVGELSHAQALCLSTISNNNSDDQTLLGMIQQQQQNLAFVLLLIIKVKRSGVVWW